MKDLKRWILIYCYGTTVRDSDYTLGAGGTTTGGRRDDRRTAGRREGGGTTGGRRGDGRTAGRREDGGTTGGRRTTGDNTPATLGAHWGLGDAGERENDVVG